MKGFSSRLKGVACERMLNKRGQNLEGKIKTLEEEKMEKEYPSPKYTGTSSEGGGEDPSNLEVELHEDPQKEARARCRYASQMKIKQSKCPRGHYTCPEVECPYISDKQENMLLHVIKQHELSNHAEKAKEDLQKYMKEQKNKKRNLDKKEEEKRKAEEIKNQETLKKLIMQLENQEEEKRIKEEAMDKIRKKEEEIKIENEFLKRLGLIKVEKSSSEEEEEEEEKKPEEGKNKKHKKKGNK